MRAERFRQTGWALLPLRAFLGVTFVVAALQKLANPGYFDPHNPISFAATMRSLQSTSPIAPLLSLSEHAPTLVGLLIALGELAAGLGVLIGLWTRLAAAGGMLLSLTFFLTVSWHTSPYYYGSDIVFLFAWTPFLAVGAAGVLSVDAWLQARARRDNPTDPDRRAVVLGLRAAGVAAVGAGVLGGLAALVGRWAGGTTQATAGTAGSSRAPTGPGPGPGSAHSRRSRSRSRKPTAGTPIATTSAVPTGHAVQFHDPSSGEPAYVVHGKDGTFAAFSAVCTHAGCTVGFDGAQQEFVCPCHGGVYSARTGQVLGGPPPAPLARIPVSVRGGQIWVT